MGENVTPAMQQYREIKELHSDCVIFFRMGDFYEMFGDDAHIAHKVLGINVTSRNKNALNPEALAGFPHHAKDKYLPILVQSGYKVAIVEQVSDPKLKGIVKREVVRIVTPSTLSLEGDNFDNLSDNSVILSIVNVENKFALSVLDISTNKWQTKEFNSFDLLSKELYKLNPKEVILEKKLFSNDKIKEVLQKKYSLNIYYYEFNGNSKVKLLNHFKTKSLVGFGIENKDVSIYSCALLLDYLEENQKQNLQNFDTISYIGDEEFLELDDATLKNLDIIFNFSTQSQELGTLFGVLNDTKTSMGKRYLKQNLLKPLYNIEQIEKRQKFIEEFLKDKILLDEVRQKLSYISDIDAILNRLALQRITPRDLLNLKKSLISLVEVIELINQRGSDVLKQIIN